MHLRYIYIYILAFLELEYMKYSALPTSPIAFHQINSLQWRHNERDGV